MTTKPTPELVALLELSAIADEMRSRKFDHAKRRSPTLVKWADRIDDAIEATRAAALPQGDALDARRYRFLRDAAHPDSDDGLAVTSQSMTDWGKWYAKHYSGANLDAAIDAATTPPPAELGKGDAGGR